MSSPNPSRWAVKKPPGYGVALHSAKFHLDKLVEEGLARRRVPPTERTAGTGGGRPARPYRRSDRERAVSLPARHYELAGEVIASAMDEALREKAPLPEAIRTAARAADATWSAGDTGRPGPAEVRARRSRVTGELRRSRRQALEPLGYEPRIDDHEVCLANCPFDKLAADHTALICGMNLDFVDGVVEGLDCRNVTAALAPHEGFAAFGYGATRTRIDTGGARD